MLYSLFNSTSSAQTTVNKAVNSRSSVRFLKYSSLVMVTVAELVAAFVCSSAILVAPSLA